MKLPRWVARLIVRIYRAWRSLHIETFLLLFIFLFGQYFQTEIISSRYPELAPDFKFTRFAYSCLWFLSLGCAFYALRKLYGDGLPEDRIFRMPIKWFVAINVFASATAFVAGFGTYYFELSTADENAFNKKLDIGTAMYFSLITFATVGFGDIYPQSGDARLLVAIQVIFSIAYTVGMFSLIASFLRTNNAR